MAVMLSFLFLHISALLWVVRFYHICKRSNRKSDAPGRRTRKRMERCAPQVLKRAQRQQIHCGCAVHRILVFTLFVFLHVPACSPSVVPTDGCRFWKCRHSLQMCVIYGCWFCRRKGMHFRNEWVCHFVSSLCYLAVCWQSPSLYKVAIFFGVTFPIFPPGTDTSTPNDTRTTLS